jgi:hypothetical protein
MAQDRGLAASGELAIPGQGERLAGRRVGDEFGDLGSDVVVGNGGEGAIQVGIDPLIRIDLAYNRLAVCKEV